MARFRRAAEARLGLDLRGGLDLHHWSVTDVEGFWTLVWDHFNVIGSAEDCAFQSSVLPEAHFFPNSTLNLAENLLHGPDAAGGSSDASVPGPSVIVTCEGEAGARVVQALSRQELVDRVAEAAALLRAQAVQPGDRVVMVLPVGLDALVMTLAALSVGAVVSSIAPEFGAASILDRFGQLDPALLVAAPTYRWSGRSFDRTDSLVEVVAGLPTLRTVLLAGGGADGDNGGARVEPLAQVLRTANPHLDLVGGLAEAVAGHEGAAARYEQLPFDHPAYVLFSSGTTGRPKCLVHRAGGVLLKHLVEMGLHCDLGLGDRLLFYSTTSWMMWNWQVSVLALGGTLVLHDGAANYPDILALIDAARIARVTHLGVGARLLDQMRRHDRGILDGGPLDDLRMVLVTGSPLSTDTAMWLSAQFGPRVMINPVSGGTDLVGCFVGGDPTRPYFAGEMSGPVLGMDVAVFDDDGQPLAAERQGELVCRGPFPTVPLGIWGDPAGTRLHETYFARWPGVWAHGDLASWTANGGMIIHGRSDATLNAGGVRIGTAEIYAALGGVREVEEALAFGQDWDGDTRIVLLVVPAPGVTLDDRLREVLRARIREHCSPRHVPARIAAVSQLPRTSTGKLAEVAVRDVTNGRTFQGRDSLANPLALDEITRLPELRS